MLDKRITIIIAVVIIAVFIIFSNQILTQFKLMAFLDLLPYDLVFDPGYDATQYDGANVINCLHGGACPSGIHYQNDDTKEIEDRAVSSPKTINDAIALTDNTQQIQPTYNAMNAAQSADILAYFMYGMVILGLVALIIYLIKRKKKMIV